MNVDEVVQLLKRERSCLDAAIQAPRNYQPSKQATGKYQQISQALHYVGCGPKAYLRGDEAALGKATEEDAEVGWCVAPGA